MFKVVKIQSFLKAQSFQNYKSIFIETWEGTTMPISYTQVNLVNLKTILH